MKQPELPGCITCGETIESAVANALDAKRAWLETAKSLFGILPKDVDLREAKAERLGTK